VPKSSVFLAFSTLLCFSSRALPQAQGTSEELFSPSAAQIFYEIAYESVNAKDVNDTSRGQALVFLSATTHLDTRANYVLPEMIELAGSLSGQYDQKDYSEFILTLLDSYVDKNADLEIVGKGIRYLLERLNSRDKREELLSKLLQRFGSKNAFLDSELATLLGLLLAEKADVQAAQSYLMQAYNSNRYNSLAFTKLAELAPDQIGPAMYLEHLRLAFAENPLDIEAAFAFARYAERLQLYQTAADAYEYCATLFKYIHPSETLPPDIYLRWALSNYNTQRGQNRSLQIASELRESGHFDLLLETIAARAAAKSGDAAQAAGILRAAEEKALEAAGPSLPQAQAGTKPLTDGAGQTAPGGAGVYQQLAWFYCFASPDANKAIDWANKAYSVEPYSASAAALLAYALTMNDQAEWAKPLIDNYERNQIADLAMAQIQLAEEQSDFAKATPDKKDSAPQGAWIETLKAAVAKDPGTLEAELAKEIMARHGIEYMPPIDPDLTLAVLRNSTGQTVVPVFSSPDKIISVRLNLRGSKFSYANDFGASVAITNNSTEPLVVSDEGLFTGNIRIDAKISGDINQEIENLVCLKTRPSTPIDAGKSLSVPVRLPTGELRQTLLTHPQASVDIEFTVYLDPVVTEPSVSPTGGQTVTNRLAGMEPAKVVVNRPGVELAGGFLRNRFNSFTKGMQGQKIKTAQLFTGLLAEEHALANREPPYKLQYADWMPDLLKSALVQNLKEDDWVTKVHTMAWMTPLPLDYDMLNALSENLNETHWPARLMAVYLLAKNQGSSFTEALNWTARYDPYKLVRDMAVELGATPPPPSASDKSTADKSAKQPTEPNSTPSASPPRPASPPASPAK
jgi:hypothetical protein